MKILGLREVKQTLSECIDHAQEERILITRHGRPAAVVIGVEGQEMEDVLLQMDPKFWEMIEERRRSTSTIPLDEARQRLAARDKESGTERPAAKIPGRKAGGGRRKPRGKAPRT